MTVRLASPTALAFSLLTLAAPQSARGQAAQVDRSTPHTQNGLTLVAIVRGDANGQYRFPVPASMSFLSGPTSNGPPGGIGLWVKGAASARPPGGGGRFPQFSQGQPTASAVGTGGETLPVQSQPQFSPYSNGQPSATPLYFLSLPGGYPDGYGPIDVNMSDPQGHHARWRLVHLPPAYHAITGAVATRAAFTHGPVTLRVQAWRDDGPQFARFNSNTADFRGVGYRIAATIPAKSQWTIRITRAQLEWEALRPGEQPVTHYPPNFPHPAVFTADLGQTLPRPPGFPPAMQNTAQNTAQNTVQGTVRTPYGAHDHYLRLSGQLVQLATAQESLTFHNLSVHQRPNPYNNTFRTVHSHNKFGIFSQIGPNGRPYPRYVPPPSYEISGPPQTATTPSGISVTLLSPSSVPPRGQSFGGGFGGGVQMVFKFNGAAPGMGMMGMAPVSLPRSPLARAYHKPVSFTLQAPRPYFLQNFFPFGGYYPQQQRADGQEFLGTLMMPFNNRPTFVTRPNAPKGARFPVFTPPVVPKHFTALTFTVAQRAELKSIPISFLVPIGNQAPPSLYPQFQRRALMPGRPR